MSRVHTERSYPNPPALVADSLRRHSVTFLVKKVKDEEREAERREREEGGRPHLSCVSMVDGYERSHMRVQWCAGDVGTGRRGRGARENPEQLCREASYRGGARSRESELMGGSPRGLA